MPPPTLLRGQQQHHNQQHQQYQQPHPGPSPPQQTPSIITSSRPSSPCPSHGASSGASSVATVPAGTSESQGSGKATPAPGPPRCWSVLFLGLGPSAPEQQAAVKEATMEEGGQQPEEEILRLCAQHGQAVGAFRRQIQQPQQQEQQGEGAATATATALHVEVRCARVVACLVVCMPFLARL